MLIHQLDATRSYLLPSYCDEDEKARAVIAFAESALAAEPPAPAEPDTDAVLTLAAIIREVDGNNSLGAAALAEAILAHPNAASVFQPPAPAPAADGEREEREELATFLTKEAVAMDYWFESDTAKKVRRAAALLRQLPPEGLEAIQYWAGDDGAVIQRTLRAPESWAIRAGIACMSTTGEWNIEPMPSDRTDEWLANHRWPSAAAAWAALQQARGQEVGDE
jgi:hypothetical protein